MVCIPLFPNLNQRSVTGLAFASVCVCVIGTRDASYGTSPSVATAEGRERTPREMFSATMTGIISDAHYFHWGVESIRNPHCL